MDAAIDTLFKSGHIWGGVALVVLFYVVLPRVDKLLARHVAFLDKTDARLDNIEKQTADTCKFKPATPSA